MISTCHMPPLAWSRDYVISVEYSSEVLRKKIQNNGESWHGEVKPIFLKWENLNYRFNTTVPGLSIILNFFLSNSELYSIVYTLSISHMKC